MSRNLKGKVVIVTGASSGIGRAAAQLLVREGCKVALVARRGEILEEMAAEMRSQSGFSDAVLALPADVTDRKQMDDVVGMVETLWNRVDVLVNNAGVGVDGPVAEVKMEHLRQAMEVNYFGAINCVQAVVPLMKKNGGGTIVNVSSILGRIPFPNFGGYVASKHALEAMDACLRMELARDNIAVCLVRPAKTKTEFGKNTIESGFHYERSGRGPASEPAEKLAKSIARAVQNRRRFTTRTLYGKLLIAWRDVAPASLERFMISFLPDFTKKEE